MGDFQGHPFRGNQWTNGSSVHEGAGSAPKFADDDWAQRGTPAGHVAKIDPATGRVVIEKAPTTATKDGSAPTADDNPTGRFSKKAARNLANYESIIRRQDYESAALTDAEGNVLFSKDGASDHVQFSPDEVAKMSGAVLTHNHPSNGNFSDDDLHLFFARGLKEIRAVGRKGALYRFGVRSPLGPNVMTSLFTSLRERTAAVRWQTRSKISRGLMTVDQANAGASEEMHAILTSFVKDFPRLGLYYKRKD